MVVPAGLDDEETFHVWPSGAFSIPDLVEGRHTVRIEAQGHVPYRAEIDLRGDRALALTCQRIRRERIRTKRQKPRRRPIKASSVALGGESGGAA